MDTLWIVTHAEREERFSNPGHTEVGLLAVDFSVSFVAERVEIKTLMRGMAFRYLQIVQAFMAPHRFPAASVKPCVFLGGPEKFDDSTQRVVETYCEFSGSDWVSLKDAPPSFYWIRMKKWLKRFGKGLVLCTGRQFCEAARLLKIHSNSVAEVAPEEQLVRLWIDRGKVVENPCWEKQTLTRGRRSLRPKPDG